MTTSGCQNQFILSIKSGPVHKFTAASKLTKKKEVSVVEFRYITFLFELQYRFSVDLFPVYNKKVTINRVILVLLMNPKQCWVSGARAGCLHSPVLPLSKLI